MTAKAIKALLTFLCSAAVLAIAQAKEGPLWLAVTDGAGHSKPAAIHITSQSNQFDQTLTTSSDGTITISRLPYGIYRIEIQRPGFAETEQSVEINSFALAHLSFQLKVSPLNESVTVMHQSAARR